MDDSLEVEILPFAVDAIEAACDYRATQVFLEGANNYHTRMRAFALSLGNMPLKYAKGKRQQYAIFDLRCAVFEGTYIFVYQVFEDRVLIVDVVNGSLVE